ncbi:PTS IIA-like nitrogen regulatory protein PtsN [Thalassotalea sp. PLHSN55]|uniref:PTS IIA-like nitrogen regulatory protein PtsN n=1 Tax=Thalassotalea sp. PLHSN55 TaxID=3435888 RepID=UPI003F84A716
MKFQDILTLNCTHCAVSGSSKKRILEQICLTAAEQLDDISQQELLESLMVRERMGSTGIGGGIAIPHGRLPTSSKIVCVVVTSAEAIAFDAVDNRPVDIFIALFVPEASCKEHLNTLQSIAKLFSDKQICKGVRSCTTDQELFEFIQQQ